jgi:hypothetical protein
MKFLAIDQGAAEELVSDRFLQSTEFEPGATLAAWLAGEVRTIVLNPRIHPSAKDDGFCILARKATGDNLLVIDESSAHIFSGETPVNCLLILQKLCRFAVRYWRKLRPNRNELFIQGSTKAVVFPYPISNQTSYRIVIEREPDKKRLQRRSAGAFLLAYRSGTGEGEGPAEQAPLTEFRKALKAVDDLRATLAVQPAGTSREVDIPSLHVTALDQEPAAHLPPQQGFDRWLTLVTAKQSDFICAPLLAPHRIEGPAGTGKTLCLILRCIYQLREATREDIEHSSVFVAHSEATRKSIQDLFDANDRDSFSHRDRYTSKQSLKVTTLHQLCGELLNTELSESEFLDRDAMESKNAQLLYVNEAVHDAIKNDFDTYKRFMSDIFSDFISKEDEWNLSEMIQHEISVLIKGRAEDDLEKYRRMPFLQYGLPVKNDADRGFVFLIFQKYQDKLRASAQFDTDDIVLTAVGQLNTPIWRRRRQREGYDSLFIDETHLFNMNELSVFHYLTRTDSAFPIAYSVDRSQSLGDRGWSDATFDSVFENGAHAKSSPTIMQSVFRCAPDIVNLAFAITSSGATLFTNFDDPLKLAASAFIEEEERKSAPPNYYAFPNDDEMVAGAFQRAEALIHELDGSRPDVLIVAFDPLILDKLIKHASQANKPIEVIKERGDVDVIRRALRGGRFVIGLADYVGGLEFAGVIIVGVDGGRVPPTRNHATSESSNFLSYASHNRLYVAITRARYRVDILGTVERGPSQLLKPALQSRALIEVSV